MKYIFITLIDLYQSIFSVLVRNLLGIQQACRFSPTCSSYAKNVIREHGIYQGVYLTIGRLAKCQPFASNI